LDNVALEDEPDVPLVSCCRHVRICQRPLLCAEKHDVASGLTAKRVQTASETEQLGGDVRTDDGG
jgi:hypothetical protein